MFLLQLECIFWVDTHETLVASDEIVKLFPTALPLANVDAPKTPSEDLVLGAFILVRGSVLLRGLRVQL